jgi:hypothetical protein
MPLAAEGHLLCIYSGYIICGISVLWIKIFIFQTYIIYLICKSLQTRIVN